MPRASGPGSLCSSFSSIGGDDVLPGITGSLFPSRFLADSQADGGLPSGPGSDDVVAHRLRAWWRRVESACGPASGVRLIFDLAAMPLVSLLGFRARDAEFARTHAQVRLHTRRGTSVGLIVLPWAQRPPRLWRVVTAQTRDIGADWCLVLSPPFVSLVDGRGRAMRRSLEFRFPDALHDRALAAFWTICQAGAFDRGTRDGSGLISPIDLLAERAERFQAAVRQDLQSGVGEAIGAILPVLNAGGREPGGRRFEEALTLVYRVLFLLFAESRDLLPHRDPVYRRAYALAELCRAASRDRSGSIGIWDGLAAVTRLSRSGCDTDQLIVRPFNGRLFAKASAPSLELRTSARSSTTLSRRRDAAMTSALVALGTRRGRSGREEISYADLGVEQLGAVYERVLDLDPEAAVDPERALAQLSATRSRHSARRKETGTFYTPQPLAEFVVRRTLAPLVRNATTDDILALRVVDPAMGSGAFLVAACRYLSRAYESALIDEGRCAETDLDAETRAGIRRAIAVRCLAGVDRNPVAVQLARLSLWLTSLARDKPLTFLDHHLRVGDSLLGASPDDLWRVKSDRRAARPHDERAMPLLEGAGLDGALREIGLPLRQLRERQDDSVADVRARERLWAQIAGDHSPLEPWRLACDLWCARWFWPASGHGSSPSAQELAATLDAILRGDRTLAADRVGARISAAREIARRHRFFHWPLEFADVFYDDSGSPKLRPGFDAVIGNPPWEVLRQESRTIPGMDSRYPFPESSVTREETLAFIRESGQFPSCDRGHLNLYQPFVDRSLSIARPGGRVGLVLPWGFASDDGARSLRARVFQHGGADTIVGLDNASGIFPIHRGLRFVAVVASPGSPPREIRARFGVREAADIEELPDEDEPGDRSMFPVRLSAETIRLVGGAPLRIPDARRPADLEWLIRISRAFPALGAKAGWSAEFGRELNATEDRSSFGAAGLPVIDGKHLTPFVVDVTASSRAILDSRARHLLPDARFTKTRLAYRDVSGAGNRFTLIAAMVPAGVVTTHTLFCLRTPLPVIQQQFLCGLFNSATLNAVIRMLMGGHVTTSLVEGLPIPPWTGAAEQLEVAGLASRLATEPGDQTAMDELNRLVAAMYEV